MSKHFFKKDMQKADRYKKRLLNVTNHQRNSKQNHDEISPHTCKDAYYPPPKKKTSVGEDMEKRNSLYTMDGNAKLYSFYGKQYDRASTT